MDWENYETTVKYIYEKLGEDQGIEILCYGRTCKCKGKSGVPHQLDVHFKISDGINDYRTYIECKYHKKKINKDHVMKVAEIVDDCKLNKGVIVSKKGFTPQAIPYARSKGIELQILREPTQKDKKSRAWKINVEIGIKKPIDFVTLAIDKDSVDDSIKREVEKLKFDQKDSVVLPNGSKLNLKDLASLKKKKEEKSIEIDCPECTFLSTDKLASQVKVSRVIIKSSYIEKAGEIKINADDYVKMIMEDIGGMKDIIIEKYGEVQDRSN